MAEDPAAVLTGDEVEALVLALGKGQGGVFQFSEALEVERWAASIRATAPVPSKAASVLRMVLAGKLWIYFEHGQMGVKLPDAPAVEA